MLKPIQVDHESICPGCGAVLGQITEVETRKTPSSTVNLQLLGSALEKSKKYAFTQTPHEFYQERVLRQLENIAADFSLPESIIVDTFNELKRQKRGFRSESQPIKQLIKILSKDDNYLHLHKLRKIKEKYASILNK